MNDKVNLTDRPMDIAIKMSQGNPGALTVIANLLKEDPMMGIMDVLHLDDMGMRGPQIWVAFKDHCGQDLDKLRTALRARDKTMVETVNRECPDRRAVQHGASFAT